MNNRFLLLLAVGVFAILGVGYFFVGKKKHEHANLVLMNVLDTEYFDDCSIPGSVSVPVSQADLHHYQKWIDSLKKNDIIVVYCANYACTASSGVAKELANMGFTNVYAYEAGIAEWYTAGNKCNGSCNQPYLKAPNAKPEHEEPAVGYQVISTEDLKKLIEDCSAGKESCSCCGGH